MLTLALLLTAPTPPLWMVAGQSNTPVEHSGLQPFIDKLTQFALAHHVKTDPASPQRGMIYEYFWVEKKGTPHQWIQGEALDTMHDGAWFNLALINAYRATGDERYKQALINGPLPFYLKMLNHSDELFSSDRNDARPEAQHTWTNGKEWLLQGKEKGFVPYWWDDGKSVSLEMLAKKIPKPAYPCRYESKDEYMLSGYSLGSSSHMAQDLAVMLQAAYLMLEKSTDPKGVLLRKEIQEAAKNLQDCRARHGAPNIPAVVAALAVCTNDDALRKKLPEATWANVLNRKNHYRRAFFDFVPGQKVSLPGFADDQQYRYYVQQARGAINDAAAFEVIYDALTEPMSFDRYHDDAPRMAGMNRFDLSTLYAVDGKLEHLRSQRKGPNGGPAPLGSRFGPQNMVCTAWALQLLKARPGLWAKAAQQAEKFKIMVPHLTPMNGADVLNEVMVKEKLLRELACGLNTWKAVFDHFGYIPTGIGCQSALPGVKWDAFSDTGGYAHLISAASEYLMLIK